MQFLAELPGSSGPGGNEDTCMPHRCRTCAKLKVNEKQGRDEEHGAEETRLKRFSMARQATVRRVSSAPSLRISFSNTIRRLRRGQSVEKDSVSRRCTCKATLAAQPTGPDVGHQVGSTTTNPRHEPRTVHHPVPQLRRTTPKDSEAYYSDENAQQRGAVQPDGAVGVVSRTGFDTAVAHSHSATTPERPDQAPSTYKPASDDATAQKESAEHIRLLDNMTFDLGATMIDLRSELEWLDPGTTLHRDFSLRLRLDQGGLIKDFDKLAIDSELVSEGRDAGLYRQDTEYSQGLEALPELDQEYQSSDSGLSTADEVIRKHLKPAQSMRDVLPGKVEGRFGSCYGVSNDSKGYGLDMVPDAIDWRFGNAEANISRFSWGSSVYSDAGEDSMSVNLNDEKVWWKPRPLVVQKDSGTPPPIPERNPLRLIKKLGNSLPRGFGDNVRRSRNIHNLHLDLSLTGKSAKRKSWRASGSSRNRSKMPSSSKQKPTLLGGSSQPILAFPGHILDAMRSPMAISETSHTSIDKKVRQSARTSEMSTSHPSSSRAGIRGHVRATSEPFRDDKKSTNIPCKWNESMPLDGCVRRTCMVGRINEVKPRRSVPSLAINKRLPPLPV
ncbi:hypothetical protein ACEQ8H_003086 [Pleosporales sp. CAS-2024a]